MSGDTLLEVSCRCGSVRIQIAGAPLVQAYCHCRDCQAAHGAAYVATAAYPAEAVRVVSGSPHPDAVRSARRFHCGTCGTRLFTEVSSVGLRSVNAYLLPRGAFAPQFHLHCDEALLPVRDDLPHYRRLPAVFGGSDAEVNW